MNLRKRKNGGVKVFCEKEFKGLLARKGLSVENVARLLGISPSTLYRKMTGQSDFYLNEIQKIYEITGEKNLDYVFFA